MKMRFDRQKLTLAAAIAVSAVVIYAGVKSPQMNLLGTTPPKKTVEFTNTRLTGWNKDLKIWELSAREIWSTKSQDITTFEDVKDGLIFKKGRPVVKELNARRVEYHKWSKEINAYSSVAEETGGKGYLSAMVDVNNLSSDKTPFREVRFVYLEAERIVYNSGSDMALATGGVVVREKGFSIYGDRMEVDGKTRAAKITGNLTIKKDDTKMTGSEMTSDFEKDSHTITGGVEIIQKDKAAVGDVAVLGGSTGRIRLDGNVSFLIEKGDALLNEDAVKSLKTREAKTMSQGRTLLTSDTLSFSTRSKDAEASGNVVITQSDKKARSDRANYTSADGKIVLTGNVYIQRDKEWLKTKQVIVSVSGESFEAVGGVEAEFKIKR